MTYSDWHIPLSIGELTLRQTGLEEDLLLAYYHIVNKRHLQSRAGRRLLDRATGDSGSSRNISPA